MFSYLFVCEGGVVCGTNLTFTNLKENQEQRKKQLFRHQHLMSYDYWSFKLYQIDIRIAMIIFQITFETYILILSFLKQCVIFIQLNFCPKSCLLLDLLEIYWFYFFATLWMVWNKPLENFNLSSVSFLLQSCKVQPLIFFPVLQVEWVI